MDRGWELSHDDGWAYEIGPMFKAKITKKQESHWRASAGVTDVALR